MQSARVRCAVFSGIGERTTERVWDVYVSGGRRLRRRRTVFAQHSNTTRCFQLVGRFDWY